jgi:hypothetical protein
VADTGTYKSIGAYANAELTYNGNSDWTLTVTSSGVNPAAGSPMGDVYPSQVQIGLFAFNPPSAPGRSSHVLVKGSFNTAFVCNQIDGCSISDGSAQVGDSHGKFTFISFRPEDKAANPFMVMADSSNAPNGVSITLGVSCVGAHKDPTVYSAKIEIQFLNQ